MLHQSPQSRDGAGAQASSLSDQLSLHVSTVPLLSVLTGALCLRQKGMFSSFVKDCLQCFGKVRKLGFRILA